MLHDRSRRWKIGGGALGVLALIQGFVGLALESKHHGLALGFWFGAVFCAGALVVLLFWPRTSATEHAESIVTQTAEQAGSGNILAQAGGDVIQNINQAPIAPLSKRDDRPTINLTPAELCALFEGRTTLQNERLAPVYVGKWMRVSGRVHDVVEATARLVIVAFDRGSVGNVGAYAMFSDKALFPALEILLPGQRIAVFGQLSKVDALSLTLIECELLVESEPPG